MWPFSKSGKKDERRVRYAVVGLGWIAQAAVLPAFANSENSELTALVSDDPEKLAELGEQYGVEHRYSYDQYDKCLESGAVDAVYIALPNTMHREYTVAAARAGIHVLCEKPLAASKRDCDAMIAAAAKHRVKLMTAYRLHFEPANLKAVEIVQSGKLGDVRVFSSVFTQNVKQGDIRLKKALGGGTLWDIGIYCLNAARYLFRAEPVEVQAFASKTGGRRFGEVEEMATVNLRFPDERLASFTVSFGASSVAQYKVVGTKAQIDVEPAYGLEGERRYRVIADGVVLEEETFPSSDQFAPELTHFSHCVLANRQPEPDGHEGRIDVQVIEAAYRSAATGKPVRLKLERKRTRPTRRQEKTAPARRAPALVNAKPPQKK